MMGKINKIENKQKKQIEGLKFILENGNIKNSPNADKIMSGDSGPAKPDEDTYKSKSAQPKYNLNYPQV